MKKLFVRTGLVLACSVAASVAAYDLTLTDAGLVLTVNGQACLDANSAPALVSVNVNGTAIDINTEVGEFTCGSVTVLPPSSSSSSSSVSSSPVSSSSSSSGGTPAPGVDLSACGGSWPNGIYQGATLSLLGVAKTEQALLGNNTVSFPVQTLNPGHYSRIIVNGLSNSLGVGRDVWVSECPGGPVVATGNCFSNSMESTTIRLWQGPTTNNELLYCNMQENKQYFINVKNTNCSNNNTNCGFYRTIK